MKNIILVAVMVAITSSLSACGGGGATLKTDFTTVSRGQQLSDLKKAHDDGAITDDEYAAEKSRVLSSK